MQNVSKLILVILIGLFCSACINTPAVHKLNQIAVNYLKEGQIDTAISRFEASVELDGEVYESRYNLAVAYLQKNDCESSYKHIVEALKIVDNDPAAYYTHGVVTMCLYDKLANIERNANNKGINTLGDVEKQVGLNKKCINLLKEANGSFDMYTKLAPNAEDTQVIISKMRENDVDIEKRISLENTVD